jgi:tRNA A-37 threonylcarbamoyl transferase component Bud32
MSSGVARRQSVVSNRYAYTRKYVLGKGAFAEVFLGQPSPPPPPGSGRPRYVAVKRIDQKKLANSRMQRQMRNEIMLLRDLSGHPNIVQLLDCFEDAANRYVLLVLEYCDGGDLSTYLRANAPLSPDVVQDMVQQIASAVCHMRERNVVHRDLKPQNILLSCNTARLCGWCLKLADFGLACRLTDQDMTATYCGSPLHMAPELVAGGRYAPGVDLWSIGTIIYQMVTGVLPFRAATLAELRQKLQDATRRNATVPLPDTCPTPLADMVRGLLHPDPAKRLTYDAFYHHLFLCEGDKPSTGGGVAPVVTCVTQAATVTSRPAAALAYTVMEVDVDSYCLIDRHMEEFRFLLDQLQAVSASHLDAPAHDEPRQHALRRLADGGVKDAKAIFDVADLLRPAEALLLYARALALLRYIVDQARPYMDSISADRQRPCRWTLATAFRFRRCMEHCLARAGELRRLALHQDALQTGKATRDSSGVTDTSDHLTPQQAMMDAALDLIRRARRRDTQTRQPNHAGLRPLALALYDRALRLLRLLQQGPGGTARDQEQLCTLLRRTEQRRNALDPHTVTPVASSLLQQQLSTPSQYIGGGDASATTNSSHSCPSSTCSQEELTTVPLRSVNEQPYTASAPIPVPGVAAARRRQQQQQQQQQAAAASLLHDSATCRARFCGQCGLQYKCHDDNYCSMCGTERREVATPSLSGTPSSLARSLPAPHV